MPSTASGSTLGEEDREDMNEASKSVEAKQKSPPAKEEDFMATAGENIDVSVKSHI